MITSDLRYFSILIFLFVSFFSLNAQEKFDPSLLDHPKKNGKQVADQLNLIEVFEYTPEDGRHVFLENGLRSHKFINETDWLSIADTVEAYQIDIVYSKYPLRNGKYNEIYPLLFNRIKATIEMDASLNSTMLEWNKVMQTHCENDLQVDSLFHGVVIWYRTDSEFYPNKPDEDLEVSTPVNIERERLESEQMSWEEVQGNIEYMLTSTSIPDSLKNALLDKSTDEKIAHLKRHFQERILNSEDTDLRNIDSATYNQYVEKIGSFVNRYMSTDPVVSEVLNRHPEWQNVLIVNDWTGSMYGYGAQVVEWHLLNLDHSGIKQITLFNDGDHKAQRDKEIGETEGIYTEDADNIDAIIDLFNYVMLKGGGGDGPENDIEAILHAMEENPDFSELVLIADNNACVRDIELADRIGVPVRIILCGYSEKRGVNKHYAHLAHITGGGIYTIDQDIEDLKVKTNQKGEVVSIPDERLKLSSSKCNNRAMRLGKKVTEYNLKTARFRKRKVRILNASNYSLETVPNWVFRCYYLKELDLSENRLTELSSRISYLNYLAKLNLSKNRLEELPRSFKRIKFLTHLNVSDNKLNEIPEQLKMMKHLKDLDLSNNEITKIHSLKTRTLGKLNLANNNIAVVPASIRRYKNLSSLNLSGNKLTKIPENLPKTGNTYSIAKLDLSNNQISSLPDDLTPLMRLDELNLSGNQLSHADKQRLKKELIHTQVIL
jgi:hypothetical protein